MTRQKKMRRREPGGSASRPAVDRLYGTHSVEAALRNPAREIRAVYHTSNAAERIARLLDERKLRSTLVAPEALMHKLGRDTVHQGLLVEAAPLPEPGLDTLLSTASATGSAGPLIVLDQVTDPHNVGAILRSAAAFGASALIMQKRHSPPLDGILAKAASGALEHIPVARVTNLARALGEIAEAGIFLIGLDGDAGEALEEAPLDRPCALVLGAEGKGLRRLTAENCDTLRRVTTHGPLASLNVSNAAAIALHACLLARNAAALPEDR